MKDPLLNKSFGVGIKEGLSADDLRIVCLP
jgi:hypothetical protein